MRRFVLAAMMFGAVSGAHAADMPDFLRGSLPAEPVGPRANWQGYYVGGQAAYGSVASNPSSSLNSDLQSTFRAPTVPPGLFYNWTGLGQAHGSDVGYGGFAGYNSQWDEVVIGIEGNYLHSGLKAYTTATGVTYAGIPPALATVTHSNASINLTDFGSARFRAGYVIGCFLPYVYGGAGLGSQTVQRDISATPGPDPLYGPMSSNARTKLVYGYSAGVGVDVMLMGGLFMRAEYEYQRITSTIESNINSARLGIGYKF
jgi:opacity protein-like surface antigen